MSDPIRRPPGLPKQILEEFPLTKLIWLWLLPLGWMEASQRDIAEALGVAQNGVNRSLKKLRALGLVEYETPPQERKRGKYRAVDPR